MADIVAIAALEAAAAKISAAKSKGNKQQGGRAGAVANALVGAAHYLPSAREEVGRHASEDEASADEGRPKFQRPKNEAEAQRMQLERLMRNPTRPVVLPERKTKQAPKVRDFNLDVMGACHATRTGGRRCALVCAHRRGGARARTRARGRLERWLWKRRLSRVPRGAAPRGDAARVRARRGSAGTFEQGADTARTRRASGPAPGQSRTPHTLLIPSAP